MVKWFLVGGGGGGGGGGVIYCVSGSSRVILCVTVSLLLYFRSVSILKVCSTKSPGKLVHWVS